jgi:isopenicillin-N N-acyltransferase like protein
MRLAPDVRAVYVTVQSNSDNMMVNRRGGIAVDFQWAPNETSQVPRCHGPLVHSDRRQRRAALSGERGTVKAAND